MKVGGKEDFFKALRKKESKILFVKQKEEETRE